MLVPQVSLPAFHFPQILFGLFDNDLQLAAVDGAGVPVQREEIALRKPAATQKAASAAAGDRQFATTDSGCCSFRACSAAMPAVCGAGPTTWTAAATWTSATT